MRVLLVVSILCISCCQFISSYPHYGSNDNNPGEDSEIIVVKEVIRYADPSISSSNSMMAIANKTPPPPHSSDNGSESESDLELDNVDDLIVVGKKPERQQYHDMVKLSAEDNQQIDLLTSDEEHSLTATNDEATTYTSAEQDDDDADANANVDVDVDVDVDVHVDDNDEIESHSGISTGHESLMRSSSHTNSSSIDMSDFLALIPVGEVKSIAANYYRNDAEVQRAYAFLASPPFAMLRQHITVVPEMRAFLRYLNNSGLDAIAFLDTLTNLTTKMEHDAATDAADAATSRNPSTQHADLSPAPRDPTTDTPYGSSTRDPLLATTTMPTTREQLNGLHGLVDAILDVLPQDQILATFFEKIESNEQFSLLVDNISSPAFGKIVTNLENSVQLRNLIFALHNNGIYITRIVDSLKAYFFLGTF